MSHHDLMDQAAKKARKKWGRISDQNNCTLQHRLFRPLTARLFFHLRRLQCCARRCCVGSGRLVGVDWIGMAASQRWVSLGVFFSALTQGAICKSSPRPSSFLTALLLCMPRGYDWHGGQDGATSELALAFPPEPIAVRVSFFPLLFSAWVWWSLCDAANQGQPKNKARSSPQKVSKGFGG